MSQFHEPNPYQAPMASASDYGGSDDGPVSPRTVDILRQTQPWVRFMGVLATIVAVLAVIAVLFGLLAAFGQTGPAEFMVHLGTCAIVLLIYVPPAVFLNRYASGIARLRTTHQVRELDEALIAQKSFWRFVGILTLVMLIIYVLMFLFMGAAALDVLTRTR